jgi:hypothetical protein
MLRTRFTARGEDRMFRDTFYAFGIISRLRGAVARLPGRFGALSLSACLSHRNLLKNPAGTPFHAKHFGR